MAQSSAQRDPSMEEILASIRRIIEEGEEIRQKPADLQDDFEPTPIGPAANDAMRRPLAPAPELRKDVPAVETVKPEAFAPANIEQAIRPEIVSDPAIDELSLSLEDFVIDIDEVRQVAPQDNIKLFEEVEAAAQELAAEAQAPQMPAVTNPQSARIEPEFEQPKTASAAEAPTLQEAAPKASNIVEGDNLESVSEAPLTAALERPKIIASVQIAPPKPHFEKAEARVVAAQTEPKATILSHQAERQVAASFTELSEALAASRRRPLDQIAEEMMRPMLQDWLDNNLPTLVERLVREEIERVARGAD